ncbi:MAG: hypothetical protein IJX60_01560, partial [Paludibacteraceae bacterium]|nr:hypothetical protein [Paludibacteraceae bacterium]
NQVEENGYIYLAITAGDESDMAAFFFYTEEVDEDIIIPEGIYPINYTEEYGTVQANPGVQGNGVLPSLYAKIWEDGSLEVPLWLLVGGTVEVRKDEQLNAHLEVNAYNSYGVPIHIVYDGSGTDVENIGTTPNIIIKKVMINGQLMILYNNKVFNTVGASIKER